MVTVTKRIGTHETTVTADTPADVMEMFDRMASMKAIIATPMTEDQKERFLSDFKTMRNSGEWVVSAIPVRPDRADPFA